MCVFCSLLSCILKLVVMFTFLWEAVHPKANFQHLSRTLKLGALELIIAPSTFLSSIEVTILRKNLRVRLCCCFWVFNTGSVIRFNFIPSWMLHKIQISVVVWCLVSKTLWCWNSMKLCYFGSLYIYKGEEGLMQTEGQIGWSQGKVNRIWNCRVRKAWWGLLLYFSVVL